MKAIELLNETIYNKLFSENTIPNDDILLVYMIYFQLISNPIIKFSSNKTLFWKETCKYFNHNQNGKTGTILGNVVKEIDLSNENLYKTMSLIGISIKSSNLSKLNPNYFAKICGTTGLIVFFIKDALDFLGISQDKKHLPIKIYKTYKGVQECIIKRIEKLQNISNLLYNS